MAVPGARTRTEPWRSPLRTGTFAATARLCHCQDWQWPWQALGGVKPVPGAVTACSYTQTVRAQAMGRTAGVWQRSARPGLGLDPQPCGQGMGNPQCIGARPVHQVSLRKRPPSVVADVQSSPDLLLWTPLCI